MNTGLVIALILALTSNSRGKPMEHKTHISNFDEFQPRGPGCGGTPADVFFLLDSSSSIYWHDFQTQLNFVKEVVSLFTIGENDTRVGVATFSSWVHPQFPLNRFTNKTRLRDAIGNIPYRYGDTNTHAALQYMRATGFAPNIVRKGVPKIAIVLTDGASHRPSETIRQAQLAKDEDIHIFAIGIGKRSSKKELEAIGSKPTENYVFQVENFAALESLKRNLYLYECEAPEAPMAIALQDQPACSRATMADVMFVFDSAAMGRHKSEIIQDYIGGVVEEFNFEDDLMRAGVVSKDCKGGDISLAKHSEKDEFLKDLRNLEYADLSHVMRRMTKESFTEEEGARDEARRMAIVFLDDKLHLPKRVFHEVQEAKKQNVEVFVVAVGDKVDENEIHQIASDDQYVLRIPNYDVMLGSCGDLSNKICSELSVA